MILCVFVGDYVFLSSALAKQPLEGTSQCSRDQAVEANDSTIKPSA